MPKDIFYWPSMSVNSSSLGFTRIYTLNHSLLSLLNEKLHYIKKNHILRNDSSWMSFLIILELTLPTFAFWLRGWCHMARCCNTLFLQVWPQSAAQITVWGPRCLMLDTGTIRYTMILPSSDRIQNHSCSELMLCESPCWEGVAPTQLKGEVLQTGVSLGTRVFGNHLSLGFVTQKPCLVLGLDPQWPRCDSQIQSPGWSNFM